MEKQNMRVGKQVTEDAKTREKMSDEGEEVDCFVDLDLDDWDPFDDVMTEVVTMTMRNVSLLPMIESLVV
jgi:hypothetical protein